MADKGVTEMMCYRCGRMLRKENPLVYPKPENLLALACCPDHGYLKGKIRMKKVEDESVFVVKTLKLTDERRCPSPLSSEKRMSVKNSAGATA